MFKAITSATLPRGKAGSTRYWWFGAYFLSTILNRLRRIPRSG